MKAQIGRVSELKIGNFRLSNPMALFSEDKAGAFASAEIQGNLGEQILSRFKIFLDYSHQRIILEPNKKFGEPFAPAFAGIAVEAQGPAYKTLQIVDVLADSPGSEAGLQRGDVILAVDGRAASEISLSELVELFERPVSCNLEVKRDNRSFRITLRPRKLV